MSQIDRSHMDTTPSPRVRGFGTLRCALARSPLGGPHLAPEPRHPAIPRRLESSRRTYPPRKGGREKMIEWRAS